MRVMALVRKTGWDEQRRRRDEEERRRKRKGLDEIREWKLTDRKDDYVKQEKVGGDDVKEGANHVLIVKGKEKCRVRVQGK